MLDPAKPKNTEKLVISLIAGLLFIITAAFAFEPLISFAAKSKTLPEHAQIVALLGNSATASETVSEGTALASEMGATLLPNSTMRRIGELLIPTFSGQKTLILSTNSSGSLPVSFTLSGKGDVSLAKNALRKIVAYLLPTEEEINLPDSSKAIEIVANPSKINLSYQKTNTLERWSVTGLPTPLSLIHEKEHISATTEQNMNRNTPSYPIIASCRVTKSKTHVIAITGSNESLLKSIFASLPSYLKDFSCFQRFSALTNNTQ